MKTMNIVQANPDSSVFIDTVTGETYIKADWLRELAGIRPQVEVIAVSNPTHPAAMAKRAIAKGEGVDDFMTIEQYCKEMKSKVTPGFVKYFGQRLSRIARNHNLPVGKVEDPRYGPKNAYELELIMSEWDEALANYKAKWVEMG